MDPNTRCSPGDIDARVSSFCSVVLRPGEEMPQPPYVGNTIYTPLKLSGLPYKEIGALDETFILCSSVIFPGGLKTVAEKVDQFADYAHKTGAGVVLIPIQLEDPDGHEGEPIGHFVVIAIGRRSDGMYNILSFNPEGVVEDSEAEPHKNGAEVMDRQKRLGDCVEAVVKAYGEESGLVIFRSEARLQDPFDREDQSCGTWITKIV